MVRRQCSVPDFRIPGKDRNGVLSFIALTGKPTVEKQFPLIYAGTLKPAILRVPTARAEYADNTQFIPSIRNRAPILTHSGQPGKTRICRPPAGEEPAVFRNGENSRRASAHADIRIVQEAGQKASRNAVHLQTHQLCRNCVPGFGQIM